MTLMEMLEDAILALDQAGKADTDGSKVAFLNASGSWLQTREICERLDKIIEQNEPWAKNWRENKRPEPQPPLFSMESDS